MTETSSTLAAWTQRLFLLDILGLHPRFGTNIAASQLQTPQKQWRLTTRFATLTDTRDTLISDSSINHVYHVSCIVFVYHVSCVSGATSATRATSATGVV